MNLLPHDNEYARKHSQLRTGIRIMIFIFQVYRLPVDADIDRYQIFSEMFLMSKI